MDADTGIVRYQIDKPLPPSPTRKKSPPPAPDLLPVGKAVPAPPPDERRLRVFAFDPTMGVALETAGINEVTLQVPWERSLAGTDVLGPGPVGEYLEVVDRDPASKAYYAPVNLNDPHLLARDGLGPVRVEPAVPPEMVYAVAMRTIRTFERALGRLALWSPRPAVPPATPTGAWKDEEYVQRLAHLPARPEGAQRILQPGEEASCSGLPCARPGRWGRGGALTVFTCLSHNIITHETSQRWWTGMHRPGRADQPRRARIPRGVRRPGGLVPALLSSPRCSGTRWPRTRGRPGQPGTGSGELAQQFGQASRQAGGAAGGRLRSLQTKPGEWKRAEPDPDAYRRLKRAARIGAGSWSPPSSTPS